MATTVSDDENRPYEFSFNVVDFQHRYERKDSDGIIMGEYGFITADGVYHETEYATDENGDFIITRMSYRRIGSLKDAQEIFKDRPEAAKKLLEALSRACSACKVTDKSDGSPQTSSSATTTEDKPITSPLLQKLMKVQIEKKKDGKNPNSPLFFSHNLNRHFADDSLRGRNAIPEDSKDLSVERRGKSLAKAIVRNMVDFAKKQAATDPNFNYTDVDDKVVEKMANDLYYRFNYTITSHGHQEDGYKSGRKDGSYRSQNENGVDTRVKYLSNEFGHQPNISFVPSAITVNASQRLEGYSFLWNWS
ncbi:unnamed protein product [Xylocopa violacea]|uniref:Protein lethal(3)malignant blood neoplasm 1 n=1 Tax=Xylocopa violacea TaxID=135666 RepID=A0ABP1MW11_XYLVO